MTKCEIFLNCFDRLLEKSGMSFSAIPYDAQEFYKMLKETDGESEKPAFTEIGFQILEFMQQSELKSFKAKDIAEGTALPSRKASSAMRKLVNDGYVEKWGSSPVNYALTEQGKNINLSNYKETLKDEED